MLPSKPPGAIAFTRKQESFAELILKKTEDAIARAEGDPDVPDGVLEDLYDDEYYWSRFAKHMRQQREYLHKRFGGHNDRI